MNNHDKILGVHILIRYLPQEISQHYVEFIYPLSPRTDMNLGNK